MTGRTVITVDNVVGSQIIVGNGSAAIRLTLDGASVLDVGAGPRLRVGREPRRLAVRERPALVGRDAVVARAVADLAEGRSVQLFGAPGVGRRAVAHAIVGWLGAAGHTGVQVLDGLEPHTLGSLFTWLARHFFEETWYEPDEETLRAAAEQTGASGIVVIADCDLTTDEADRLLGTFQQCVFLLTSRQQTLFSSSASAYEIDPLTIGQARELLARELAGAPADVSDAQVEEAYRLAEGQTRRLIHYSSFVRSAARHPGPGPQQTTGIQSQIMLLISGLTDPARRVLTALAGLGVAVPPELFRPLIGLDPATPTAVAAGTGAEAEIESELEASGLVALWGESYTAAPDVAAALTATGQAPDLQLAADGLSAFVTDPARSAGAPLAFPPQAPGLLLAVARALRDAGTLDLASALARAAAPAALAAGDVDAWVRLVALGVRCATAADRPQDLAYFLREQHTGALLHGDQAAATAALIALGEHLAEPVSTVGSAPVRNPAGTGAVRRLFRRR